MSQRKKPIETSDGLYIQLTDPETGERSRPVKVFERAKLLQDWHAGTARMMDPKAVADEGRV